jgi:hypothetical protein
MDRVNRISVSCCAHPSEFPCKFALFLPDPRKAARLPPNIPGFPRILLDIPGNHKYHHDKELRSIFRILQDADEVFGGQPSSVPRQFLPFAIWRGHPSNPLTQQPSNILWHLSSQFRVFPCLPWFISLSFCVNIASILRLFCVDIASTRISSLSLAHMSFTSSPRSLASFASTPAFFCAESPAANSSRKMSKCHRNFK